MELNDLYGLDFPSQLQLLPSYELRSKLSHIPTLDDFDIDENYVQTINSKYYDISELSEFQSSKNKYFSLFHVNARSLSKNFDQLLSVLVAVGISFDVLGITETKEQIGKAFTTNVNIDEYHMYTQPTKSAAGGVAIYVNNKLDHFERKDLSILHEEFESIWVEMKNKQGKNFLCGCIYRHPNTDISHFIEYMEATLSKINKKKYNVFLMGDFNIDLLQYASHNYTNDFLNTVISQSFVPYIHQPTRVTDHSATVIDNIFSNITDYETINGSITSLIADHFAQFLLIKKCHVSFKSCSYSVYDYSNFGKEKFIHDYSLLDWSTLNNPSVSVNDHFDFFYEKRSTCIDSHVPRKRVTKRKLKLRTKPWINSEIQRLMTYRDKLFKKMINHPTPSNKYLYSKFRNRVVTEQRKGKIKYFQNYFEKHKSNMKMLWSGIKSVINTNTKTQFSNISRLLDKGTQVNDPVKMANIFNNYFVNVGSAIDKTIPRTRKSPVVYSGSLRPLCCELLRSHCLS